VNDARARSELDAGSARDAEARLLRDAARRFSGAGLGPWAFASLKLRIDPIYRELLRQGMLPTSGLIADLGCGQGLTLSVIRSAQRQHERRQFPDGWAPPPRDVELWGCDVRRPQVAIARRALGEDARIERADLRTVALPSCRAALMFDSLHYLDRDEQDHVLDKVGKAVEPGGTIVVREADARDGARFDAVHVSEMLRAKLRGQWRQRFCFRSGEEWTRKLASLGFDTRVQGMAGRTPFRNVIIHGVRRTFLSGARASSDAASDGCVSQNG
jgi:SAM-dependent methyltransferase